MKIAITGSTGLFGHGLVQVVGGRHTVFSIGRAEADITKSEEVRAAFLKLRPEVIIHSAAIPSPDVCEENPALAYLVNVHGTRHIADAAAEIGAALAYISSDAVFDGEKGSPYTEQDVPIPPTVYGRTKLRGEQIVKKLPKHWMFRVSILFGPGKTNTIEKELRALTAGKEFVVASDQVGSATYTLDAAEKILEVIESGRCGLYHLSNQEPCSRYELATYAAKAAGLDPCKVAGVPSERMGRPAKRLQYAVMEMGSLRKAGFSLPRPWKAAVDAYLKTILPLEVSSRQSA